LDVKKNERIRNTEWCSSKGWGDNFVKFVGCGRR